jgi:SAM-dependent methyltransferase
MSSKRSAIEVFDRRLLRQRRERAAPHIGDYDFLSGKTAEQLLERLDLVQKQFPLVVAEGRGLAGRLRQRQGTRQVISADNSFSIAKQAGLAVVADEEFLPFRNASLDAIISNLNLHWVNDLPGALLQIRQALKPDGLFLAALLGGESLKELRQCLMEAELTVTGGASPRVSPFIDLQDMSALMQRAGFALPVVDNERITVHYRQALKLMQDLRGMGASNAVHDRLMKPTRRSVLMEASRLYHEKFADKDGLILVTFEVIHVIGWAPHGSQQKPLKPGSARNKLADALKAREISTGEKAKP